ncbi:MAG: OsmC family protein [Actinomycetes bacterium]
MATTRTATTQWQGSLMTGAGTTSLESSKLATFDVTWPARAEQPDGRTSPEELIAAAHSTCYSMALSHALAGAGNPPENVDTRADVSFQPGEGITGVHLTVRARVPGLEPDGFRKFAEAAKSDCPVSQALTGTTITLDASLD